MHWLHFGAKLSTLKSFFDAVIIIISSSRISIISLLLFELIALLNNKGYIYINIYKYMQTHIHVFPFKSEALTTP